MKVIGLTGNFSSGKTTVAKMFKEAGLYIIDADKVGHKLLKKGKKTYRKVVRLFGKGVLSKQGAIVRSKLAAIVFSDRKRLIELCDILHPEILNLISDKLDAIRKRCKNAIVVIDAALIIEVGMSHIVDALIVVKCKKNTSINRALKNGYSKSDALARINNQLPITEKIKLADYIINNEGTVTQTKKQVKEIYNKIKNINRN